MQRWQILAYHHQRFVVFCVCSKWNRKDVHNEEEAFRLNKQRMQSLFALFVFRAGSSPGKYYLAQHREI